MARAPRIIIPPSGIDPDFPIFGTPSTLSVRMNFAATKGEINDMQAHVRRIDNAFTAEQTRVNNAIYAETNRTDEEFFDEQERVNEEFTDERDRVNQQFSDEQARVNTELATKAMREGDLGGALPASTTVIGVRARPVSNTAPDNAPRPAARKILTWSGDAWAPDNVHQLQGWPISIKNPGNNHALVFTGFEWEGTPGVGNPNRTTFLPMPNDVHDWIPVGTQGWFAAERDSAGLTNAPPLTTGYFCYRAWSSTTGRIRIEAVGYDVKSSVPYVKWRDTNGTWSPWHLAAPAIARFETAGNFSYTITVSGLYECMLAAAGSGVVNIPSGNASFPAGFVMGGTSGGINRRQVRFTAGNVVQIVVGASYNGSGTFGTSSPMSQMSSGTVLTTTQLYVGGQVTYWQAPAVTGAGEERLPGLAGTATAPGPSQTMTRDSFFGPVTITSGVGEFVGVPGGSGKAVIAFIRP